MKKLIVTGDGKADVAIVDDKQVALIKWLCENFGFNSDDYTLYLEDGDIVDFSKK